LAHDRDHDHDDHGSELDPMSARVMALETLLVGKGLVDPAALDAIVEAYETQMGPRNGARVVARTWSDPAFAGTAAIASLGYAAGMASTCGQCSTPPMSTTSSSAPSAPATLGPCSACRRSGTSRPLPPPRRPSTAEIRNLVVPMRPEGTDALDEAALADLVTRDSMIGAGLALVP
jgi:nitrile hydratase